MPKDENRPDASAPHPPNAKPTGRAWPSLVKLPPVAAAQPPSSSAGNHSPADDGERWTVGRLLTWTTDYLKKRGSESARLDAEVLLAQALGWPRVQLYTRFDDDVADRPRAEFRTLVKRRADGAPVAYLVGRKEFYSLPLKVTPSVLIPRPDSEFVVVEFLAVAKALRKPVCIDVGTGSGCLALACVHEHLGATFLAIDVSRPALEIAAENAKALGLSDRITFLEGDLLSPARDRGPFDVIVSNPPYITTEDLTTLEPGVRDHEPSTALDGGSDGLRVVAPLIEQAVPLLKPGGHLILEIGSGQEASVRALLAAQANLVVAPTVRDHANHPRVLRATRVS